MGNVADVRPAGIVTVVGTSASVVSELSRLTVNDVAMLVLRVTVALDAEVPSPSPIAASSMTTVRVDSSSNTSRVAVPSLCPNVDAVIVTI